MLFRSGPLGASCNKVQGIYPSIPNGTVSNNLIYRVVAYAINTGHNSYSSKIVNNTMFGNGNPSLDGGGIVITANDFSTQSHGFIVANNVIYDSQGVGVHEEGSQGANTYSNNLVYGNNTNWGYLNSPHANDVSADPLFVNYIRSGGGNYSLQSTSPAIDKGSSTYAPPIDINGVARPRGAGIDIGAHEDY